jgi:hypothetical protein
VKVLEAAGDDCSIEAGLVSCERLHIAQIGEKLTSVDEFEHKIQVASILGEPFEVDDEGVGDLGVHEVLVVDVVDLLRLHDFVLVQQFQCHVLAALFVLGHLDPAEAALVKLCVPLPSTLPIS